MKYDLKGSLVNRYTKIPSKYRVFIRDDCDIFINKESKDYFRNKILKDKNFLSLNYRIKNLLNKKENFYSLGIVDISKNDLKCLKKII